MLKLMDKKILNNFTLKKFVYLNNLWFMLHVFFSDMEDAIERRLEILDQLLHRSVECDDENVCLSLVAKEGLLDSLLLLYDECHEHLLQNNKLVAAFVKKCKILTFV